MTKFKKIAVFSNYNHNTHPLELLKTLRKNRFHRIKYTKVYNSLIRGESVMCVNINKNDYKCAVVKVTFRRRTWKRNTNRLKLYI